ncbi:MAG: STAS domain-containing protein [Blastocatellia bacterium]
MGDLNITKRQIQGVVIVDLEGKIALGETNRQLHETIRLLVQEGKKSVVLNLSKVTTIDSSGLGELIAGYATLERNDGTLKLANIPDRVIELMTITKLYTVFDVFETEADAIASFDASEVKAKAGSSLL